MENPFKGIFSRFTPEGRDQSIIERMPPLTQEVYKLMRELAHSPKGVPVRSQNMPGAIETIDFIDGDIIVQLVFEEPAMMERYQKGAKREKADGRLMQEYPSKVTIKEMGSETGKVLRKYRLLIRATDFELEKREENFGAADQHGDEGSRMDRQQKEEFRERRFQSGETRPTEEDVRKKLEYLRTLL
jgi:hypothetical protein